MTASEPFPVLVENLPVSERGEVSVDENFLRDLFSESGKISDQPNSISIISKKDTKGKYRASAIILFETKEAATKVINEFNYTKLNNNILNIVLNDPETMRIRQSHEGCLFIKNLESSIDAQQLHNALNSFGEIISCKVPESNGVSRGYAYVQFRNPEDSIKALNELNGASINNQEVHLEMYNKQRMSPEAYFRNIYIKNLPSNYKEEDIRRLFEEFGQIQSVKILEKHNKPYISALCCMSTHDQAVNAINQLNGKEIGGVTVFCDRYKNTKERVTHNQQQVDKNRRNKYEQFRGRNFYIKNFDENVNEEELISYFSRLGEIESIKVMRDPVTQASKKFGFVLFKNKEDADKCIQNPPRIEIRGKVLAMSLAQTKEDKQRKANLNQQMTPPMGKPIQGNMMHPGAQPFPIPPHYPMPPAANFNYSYPQMMYDPQKMMNMYPHMAQMPPEVGYILTPKEQLQNIIKSSKGSS